MKDPLLQACTETIAWFNNEIDKLQPKIDNHTITPDEQRYVDSLRRELPNFEADRAKLLKHQNPLKTIHNIILYKIAAKS